MRGYSVLCGVVTFIQDLKDCLMEGSFWAAPIQANNGKERIYGEAFFRRFSSSLRPD